MGPSDGVPPLLTRRTALALAAVLCVAILGVPPEARSRGYSSKSRYSFGSSYPTPSCPHPRKSSAPKPSSFSSDPFRSRAFSPAALYPSRRRSSESGYGLRAPRAITPRRASALPSLYLNTSYRKPAALHRVPRPSVSQPEYYQNGLPKHRSESEKQNFLRQRGLKRVPAGMGIDHTVPLAAGGPDTPANMELLPKSAHRAKTAAEGKR